MLKFVVAACISCACCGCKFVLREFSSSVGEMESQIGGIGHAQSAD